MLKLLPNEMYESMSNSSWIRKMFESGLEMKRKFGPENVFDFSLGNPDLPPPPRMAETVRKIADSLDKPFALGYMPNAGYPSVRERMAKVLSEEQGVSIPFEKILMSCGAAGGLNTFLRSVLEPGEEVVCSTPFFGEYTFYVKNFCAKLVTVPSKPLTFELDFDALDKAFSDKTRVVIINSPNNPSGRIYTHDELKQLADLMKKHQAKQKRPIFLVSDEPYRFLNYDGVDIPSVFSFFPYSVIVSSFSKSLSLAGERTGYVAVNPEMPDGDELIAAMSMNMRGLGYVNAPSFGQKIVEELVGETTVDLSVYKERRDAMAEILTEAEIDFFMPQGAFYFFPKSPLEDDVEFTRRMMEGKVLTVPGRGFGCPGYFRMAFCVDVEVIRRSRKAFINTVKSAKTKV